MMVDPAADNSVIDFGASEWRRFVRQLMPTLVLMFAWIILCLTAFNVIDPYGVTDWLLIKGFNDIKPEQSASERIYKPLAFLRNNYLSSEPYNGIVIGASRELRGIDPQNPLLHRAGYRLYNFALSEERPYESAEVVDFVTGWTPIKIIIFDLDFTRYGVDPLSVGDLRTYYPKHGSILAWALKQYAREAMSLRGIKDSYETVQGSRHRQVAFGQTRDGLEIIPGGRPGLDYDYARQFANVFDAYLNRFFLRIVPQSRKWLSGGYDHGPLRKIIALANARGIRLVAFIAPDHGLEMEALRRAGLWPAFERWKRELVCVFHAAGLMHPDAGMSLWDFSGYNSVTTQRLPRPGTQNRVMDYWDPVHYALSMGDRILTRVLRSNTETGDNDGFGVELTTANIESHLTQIRADRARYAASHPDDLRWLASLDRTPAPVTTLSNTEAAHPLGCNGGN